MASYIALLRKDSDSDYSVDFPDFPGCVTAGTTLDEARRMAAEALSFHVEGMLADGEVLPEASTLDRIVSDRFNRDAVPFLVDVPDEVQKSVRVNITVPERDLRAIDAKAAKRGMTRSGFLLAAARRAIKG
jgi:predicted RNase H-like HicB family nuclease